MKLGGSGASDSGKLNGLWQAPIMLLTLVLECLFLNRANNFRTRDEINEPLGGNRSPLIVMAGAGSP
jgi:hypothetical protein